MPRGKYPHKHGFPNGATRRFGGTAQGAGQTSELKHLSSPEEEKNNSDCASSGERTRKSPNRTVTAGTGVVGPSPVLELQVSRTVLEKPAAEGESPVREDLR